MQPFIDKPEDVYHDTELLLKKYRRIRWKLQCDLKHLKKEMNADFHATMDEILEMMVHEGITRSEARLYDIIHNCEITLQVIDLLDTSLAHLKAEPEHGETYYWILYYTYLTERSVRPVETLLDKLEVENIYVSRRRYFDLKQEAVEALGDILWGYAGRDVLFMLQRRLNEQKLL